MGRRIGIMVIALVVVTAAAGVTTAGALTRGKVINVKLLGGDHGPTRADESGAVGEIEELKPGETQRLTLTLTKGHYALLCNLPGHYKAGQFIDFYVV